jgi:hypothetical protein
LRHQEDERHVLVERSAREPARHRGGDAAAPEPLAHADPGELRHSLVRRDADARAGGLARCCIAREHDDTAARRRALQSCDSAVGQRLLLAVRLPLHLRRAAKLVVGRRRDELDARWSLEPRLPTRHQRQAAFDRESRLEQRLLHLRGDRRDVLQARPARSSAIRGDELLDIGRGRDAAAVGNRVVEVRVVRVSRERREKRPDPLGLAAARRVVAKRFLDPS